MDYVLLLSLKFLRLDFYLDKRNVYRPIPKQMLLTENGLFQSNRQNAPIDEFFARRSTILIGLELMHEKLWALF